jgi:hypothetical protein
MINRGIAKKLTKKEMEEHKGLDKSLAIADTTLLVS